MDTQFWWFYDVIVLAVVLIFMFLCGKRGIVKSILSTVSWALAAVIAFSISGGIASSIYSTSIRGSNIKKIEKNMDSDFFAVKMVEYIDSLPYGLRAETSKVNAMFDKGNVTIEDMITYINNINGRKAAEDSELREVVIEGYAKVIGDMLSKDFSDYIVEYAKEEVRKNPANIADLIPLIRDRENPKPASSMVADNYTAPAYRIIIRLLGFIILTIVIGIFAEFIIKSFTSANSATSTTSNLTGALVGIAMGLVVAFIITAMVRLYVIMGTDHMMFFNTEAIDKTYVFKYIFNIVQKM
ncbi:MAG: CvpA family protein [Ruminococcus sp.]|nr:CvpA family protein [Ruminococcus sp.]